MVNLQELHKNKKQEAGMLQSVLSFATNIIPQEQRQKTSHAFWRTMDLAHSGLVFAGRSAWVLSTSFIVLFLPMRYVLDEEAQLIEQERQYQQMYPGGAPGLPGLPGQIAPPSVEGQPRP